MKILGRALATFGVEAVALILWVRFLPGVRLAHWEIGIVVVLVVGLLNASVRPLVLLAAVNLSVLFLAAAALALNVAIFYLAAALIPGFSIQSAWAGILLALGLSVLNALVTAVLSIGDDDAYYRNVIRWMDRRRAAHGGDLAGGRRGTIIIQIDGLAEPLLRRELDAGRLPAIKRWLDSGSHRLVRWDCGVPSMTPGSQAGILHGNNANVPAFRWYEKELQRLVVANHPKDAAWIDQRQSTQHGLLREHGASNSNIFSGDAQHMVMTQAGLVDEHGKLRVRSRDFYSFLLNPYNLYRTLAGMIGEVALEYWQAWRQRRNDVRPRMRRGGVYPLVRASSAVLLRNIAEYCVIDDMYTGRLVSYTDFVGYDEVAHHSGPATEDALGELRKIDRVLHALETAAGSAPRPYQFVLLSDHGQSTGSTFRQRFGYTLAELVDRLVQPEQPSVMAGGRGEGLANLSAVLTEAASSSGGSGWGARQLLGGDGGLVALGPDAELRGTDLAKRVVVCASGNLALIYFTDRPGRLSLEVIEAAWPDLIPGLVGHAFIGFVLIYSEAEGPLVLGRAGSHRLRDGVVKGEDPLAPFDPRTAGHVLRLSTFTNAGDIIVNSSYDARADEVAAFEELVGSHGGAGGLQTQPFLLFPNDWTAQDPDLSGAEAVHTFLSHHLAAPG